MKGSSHAIYNEFSFYSFVWAMVLRFCCALGLMYVLSSYNENPVLIVFVAVLIIFFILIIGYDSAVVYKDRVVFHSNSFLSFFTKSRGQTIYIKDIKKVFLPIKPKTTLEEGIAAGLVLLLTPRRLKVYRNHYFICFELKNGEEKIVPTELGGKTVRKLIEVVNSLISD